MDLKKLLAGGVAVLVALLVFLLWPSAKVSPEEQVRALIAECVTAAEKHDVSTFMEHLSQDFRGPSGASRDEVKSILVSQLFRNSNETVVFNPQLSVTVTDATHATFSGVFVFARGKEANWQAPVMVSAATTSMAPSRNALKAGRSSQPCGSGRCRGAVGGGKACKSPLQPLTFLL